MSEQTALTQEVAALEPSNSGVSRRNFIALGASAIGAAALVANTESAHAIQLVDERMIRFLEEVERVELALFTRAALSGTADGLQEKELYTLNAIAKQDNEHAYWFKLARDKFAIGAISKPQEFNTPNSIPVRDYKFPLGIFESRGNLFKTAISLKETSVGAYHGAVARCKDPEIIQAVAALAGVESRHLAMLRSLAGQSPFVAYEKALRPEEVRSRLIQYGFATEVLS